MASLYCHLNNTMKCWTWKQIESSLGIGIIIINEDNVFHNLFRSDLTFLSSFLYVWLKSTTTKQLLVAFCRSLALRIKAVEFSLVSPLHHPVVLSLWSWTLKSCLLWSCSYMVSNRQPPQHNRTDGIPADDRLEDGSGRLALVRDRRRSRPLPRQQRSSMLQSTPELPSLPPSQSNSTSTASAAGSGRGAVDRPSPSPNGAACVAATLPTQRPRLRVRAPLTLLLHNRRELCFSSSTGRPAFGTPGSERSLKL